MVVVVHLRRGSRVRASLLQGRLRCVPIRFPALYRVDLGALPPIRGRQEPLQQGELGFGRHRRPGRGACRVPEGSSVALLQGGFRVGGWSHFPVGVPVLERVRESGASGEALALPGRGGAAFGEGDLAAVEFLLRGARAIAGLECEDRGRLRSNTGAEGDDQALGCGFGGVRLANSRVECSQEQSLGTSAETQAYTLREPSSFRS